MHLQKVLEQISGLQPQGKSDVAIGGITYDSRSVKPGDLFVAIKGEKSDGARFIPQAIEKGAAAVAAEVSVIPAPGTASILVGDARQFLAEASKVLFDDPSERLNLVAITGTNGKTTTSYLMDSIYRQAGMQSCLIGTIGMKIGPKSFHSEHTTPESSDLIRFLRHAVEEKCTHGALEVSSHSLSLKRVYGIRFRVGVFMNLTRDHLDFHKDMESYFQAKQILFSAENGNQVESAVINTDDPYGKRLVEAVACKPVSFGFQKDASIHVIDYQSRVDGTELRLHTPAGEIQFQLKLIGRPNIYNVMASTGAALSLGIPRDAIQRGIEMLTGIPGRVERVDAGQDFAVVVDYAHSPDALENLLHTVSQLPHAKIITVFGCGGDRDKTKRPIMGAIATKMSDFVFATSDNPRSEDPQEILKEIEVGMRNGIAPYVIQPDRRKAIESAVSIANKGDVVVIAGKGHEDYQILGKTTIHFDDREVARELIRERLKS